jgi:glucose 1-dehydrogenase
VTYKSDATSAADVVAAVKAKGRNAVAIAADMGARGRRRAHVQGGRCARAAHAFRLQRRHPGVAGRLESADSAMMREVIEVNVLGALVVDAARHPPHVEEARRAGGSIVLLSSVAADIGGPTNMSGTRPQGRGRVDHLRL